MSAGTATGGKLSASKFLDARLILVALVAVALFMSGAALVTKVGAVVVLLIVVFAVYHNGTQVSDCVVFMVVGVVVSKTFIGEWSMKLIDLLAGWAGHLPT